MSFKACRGLDDVLPAETAAWQHVEAVAKETSTLFGYREMRPPLLESADLYMPARGASTEILRRDQVTVRDRGGRSVVIRPEFTAGVLRAYIEHKVYQSPKKFHRVSYLGPVLHYQRGPHAHYTQDEQFGAEAIGSANASVDADIILMAAHFLRTIGLKKVLVQLSFRGCPLCLPSYHDLLREFIAEGAHSLCENCQSHQQDDPSYLLACAEVDCRKVARILPTVLVTLCPACRHHFETVQDELQLLGVDFSVNPLLVAEAAYYSRTIFSVCGDDGQVLACGGRYDELIEALGGPAVPAVGFAARLAACVQAVEKSLAFDDVPGPEIVLASSGEEAERSLVKAFNTLRQRGIRVERDYDNHALKAQIRYAGHLGARYLAVVGDDEVRHNAIPVRDLTRNTQEFVPAVRLGDALFQYLRNRSKGRAAATG